MDTEKLWERFQEHMGYTDEEMEVFKSDPVKVKMVTETPHFVKSRIVAEVIESHGCHSQHKVGDRFVMNASGQLLADECPKKMCMFALGPVTRELSGFYEILINSDEPDYSRHKMVQCIDVGLDKGGWGKVLMKVYLEKV